MIATCSGLNEGGAALNVLATTSKLRPPYIAKALRSSHMLCRRVVSSRRGRGPAIGGAASNLGRNAKTLVADGSGIPRAVWFLRSARSLSKLGVGGSGLEGDVVSSLPARAGAAGVAPIAKPCGAVGADATGGSFARVSVERAALGGSWAPFWGAPGSERSVGSKVSSRLVSTGRSAPAVRPMGAILADVVRPSGADCADARRTLGALVTEGVAALGGAGKSDLPFRFRNRS